MSRFEAIIFDETAVAQQIALKNAFKAVETVVNTLDNGRARALVYTKLEETYMWANKAVSEGQVARDAAP